VVRAFRGILRGGRCIAEGAPRDTFPWPAFYAEIGYALELSLKAFMRSRGATEQECAAVHHDLRRAVKKASERGLEPLAPPVEDLINRIGRHHQKRRFQYLLPIDEKKLPDAAEALAAMRVHMDDMARQMAELMPA
jgi:hypothetical protein